jgi:hypothetical protein
MFKLSACKSDHPDASGSNEIGYWLSILEVLGDDLILMLIRAI